MTETITYLTPRDHNCLANSVADTLRYLNGFQSVTPAGVLDLASASVLVVDQENLLHQLLQALLPPETKTSHITTWKGLICEIRTHSHALEDSLGIVFASILAFGDSSGAAEEEEDPPFDERLEILFHLIIAVQQKQMLRQIHPSQQLTNPETEAEVGPAVAPSVDGTPADNEDGVPMELPSHFTSEQRSLIVSCYEHMHHDYENRLQGLHQRLRLLKSNCGASTVEERQHFPNSSCALTADKMMSMTDLEDSLSRAVSSFLPIGGSEIRRNQLSTSSLPDGLQLQLVSDRGGRVDTAESRAPEMPEWTNERHEGGKANGHGRKEGGRGRGRARNNKHRSS